MVERVNITTRTHEIALFIEPGASMAGGRRLKDGKTVGGHIITNRRVVSAAARRLDSDAVWDAEIVDRTCRPVDSAWRNEGNILDGLEHGYFHAVPVEEVRRRKRQHLKPFERPAGRADL